jgi:GAF domain-containing protein
MNFDPILIANLPTSIGRAFTQSQTSEQLFTKLMPAIGEFLKADRCFLYLRDPQTKLGRVPFCWLRTAEIPQIYNDSWNLEPETLTSEDPMFAAAVRTEPSIFIEDIKTTSDRIVSRQFEAENFGHRALIHAHLSHDRQLWGVLQPCIFDRPRNWTSTERDTVDSIVKLITPIAIEYVNSALKSAV